MRAIIESNICLRESDVSFKTIAGKCINTSLRPLGIQVVRGRSTDPAIKSFISAKETVAAARSAGLSVGDYLDQNHAEAGTTAASVDAMLRLSALPDSVERVCEIGPGSGRYAEKVIAALHPQVYEAYETASDWWPHLRRLPNLITQPCDGHTLTNTRSASVDLVHAHKVFVYIPFATTAGYLQEMARVVRPEGTVAFDIVTEDCLDEQTVNSWVTHGSIFLPTPRNWAIDFLARRGLSLQGNFFAAMSGTRTELLVFRRASPR